MRADDLARDITEGMAMLLQQGSQQELNAFVALGRLRGETDLLRQYAAEMIAAVPVVMSSVLGSALVLRLGDLMRADASQVDLLRPLASDERELARARFCHILGYANTNGVVLAKELKRLATDDSPLVRRRAVQAIRRLSRFGLQDAQGFILNAVSDPDPAVREEALLSLR